MYKVQMDGTFKKLLKNTETILHLSQQKRILYEGEQGLVCVLTSQ